MRSERDSPWCRVLDDAGTGAQPSPAALAVHPAVSTGCRRRCCPRAAPPSIWRSSRPVSARHSLPVRDIILAKSPGSATADALGNILPRLAAAGTVAIGLTLLVVLLIVRAITHPLRMITAASERMARGDYDQRVPEGGADEVGQLARSFNRMASEVGAAREHQRQFIANVSHDLKTPLTSILGFSQILAESDAVDADPGGRRAVQVISEEARRLQRLTRDLLDLSRLEAGQLQMRHGLCDLDALAGEALRRYAELPANASLPFLDCRVPGPLLVLGDPDRLMQVLVNLLDNAVKFCDPGGQVVLETGDSGGQAIAHNRQHRRGDRRGGSGPRVPALLSHRPFPRHQDRRHRAGAGDRAGDRRSRTGAASRRAAIPTAGPASCWCSPRRASPSRPKQGKPSRAVWFDRPPRLRDTEPTNRGFCGPVPDSAASPRRRGDPSGRMQYVYYDDRRTARRNRRVISDLPGQWRRGQAQLLRLRHS